MGSLSGGERARVALAKVLREGANLLVFDEPTNDLDLPTLAALEEMLDGYPGSVIVVTHDRAFFDRVATAILSFEADPHGGPSMVERHAGGYEDYVAHKREERARRAAEGKREAAKAKVSATMPSPALNAPATKSPTPTSTPTKATPPAKTKSTLTYAERLELDGILARIDAAERAAKGAEADLADPALYTTAAAARLPVSRRSSTRPSARRRASWRGGIGKR